MTAIWVPEGIEVSSLVSSLASKGVQIAGGILDGLAGKYFRIGQVTNFIIRYTIISKSNS
jgi:alanine-glyoxylate transaminase/serine-glyoxylate transaminase/serine-pyruvate transaminase